MQRQSSSSTAANLKSKAKDTVENYKSKPRDINKDYKSKYHVEIKTAKKGLLGLSPTGTDANVFIQIHDEDGKVSEPIELKDSLDHKNKFTHGKIGKFSKFNSNYYLT